MRVNLYMFVARSSSGGVATCSVLQKRPPFYFLNNCQKLTDFCNFFGILNPEKNDMNILHFCPPDLSDVATLPWEFQESHFQQYYSRQATERCMASSGRWSCTLGHRIACGCNNLPKVS